ncbi:MAG TPA: 16S rRNA (adenine(1518)-N(6)/adenine(1519)-N(6))-dimethyltransferase RsmA [Terracidiphilus sp.]|jgi:16S rRNA (adenine1518-N6/adenine1519-N6)-dimethyltransferase|nr:16S rRNA (adenine(1518)-N(6)/adenine(1519)-N(6))-dimethyltransferase RsmA [Terracidiphilus sp.]
MPAKPKLGQNFLHDAQAIDRIAASLGDCSHRTVIEIGPGRGALTRALIPRVGHLIAIELDPDLAAGIRSGFPSDRVTVVHKDVLHYDFAAAAADVGDRLIVIGNLPYYITSPILTALAASHTAIDRAVLMMQREVADRVAAEPGSRDYGLLSVTVQLYGPVEKLFTLPPGAFTPPPDVHSTVIRWRMAPRFAELHVDEKTFVRFLRQAFAQKRKTLSNNLRAAGFDPTAITHAFTAASVDPRTRAEALTIAELAAISTALAPH